MLQRSRDVNAGNLGVMVLLCSISLALGDIRQKQFSIWAGYIEWVSMLGVVERLVRIGVVIGNRYQVGHHILESWQSVFFVDWVLENSVELFLMGRVGQSFPGEGVVWVWLTILGKVGVGWSGVVVVGGSLDGRYCLAP